MDPTKTWKRLATIGATTAVIAGMSPFVGAITSANAAVGSVQLVDPLSGAVITQTNGSDNLQHLYADVTQSTSTDPQIAYVLFSVVDTTTSSSPQTIAIAPVNAKSAGPDEAGTVGAKHDSFATATWQVPATTDSYAVSAQGVEGNQVTPVGGPSTNSVNAVTGANGVAISQPTNNSLVGVYDNPSGTNHNTTVVTGTTPATGTTVTAQDTPAGTTAGHGTPVTAVYDGQTTKWAAEVPLANTTGNYPTDSPQGTNELPTAGHNVSLTGLNAVTVGGNEDAPGTAYLQTFAASPNGFTLTPTSGFGCKAASPDPGTFHSPPSTADCANGTSTNPDQVYTMQATDQHGNVIAGLPVDLTFTDPSNPNDFSVAVQFRSTSGPTTWTPAYASPSSTSPTTPPQGTPIPAPASGDYGTPAGQLVTNAFGQITFRVSNTDAETVQIEAKTKFDGSFVAGTDYDIHATYSTQAQVPTSGTATVFGHPTAPIYATQSYGLGSALAGPTPGIEVNVKDASNQNIQNATVQYSYVRHVTGGQNASTCEDTNTYPVSVPTDPSSAALNSPASDASGNIYITPDSVEGGHAPYLQGTNSRCSETESGNDVFTVYIDKNGVPGFQTGDLLIGTETLPFGPESIYFKPCDQVTTYEDGNDPYANANYQTCDTQQKAGTDLTLTVFASIWDGTTRQPVTSRKIDITIPSGDNMTFSSSGNSGLTLVNSTEGDITTGAAGTATVTLSDPSPEGVDEVTASDPSLGDTITSDNAFDEVDWRNFNTSFNGTSAVTHHRYIGEITPLSEFSGTVGSPGQPLVEGFKVLDQNGDGIQDQPITLTTSAGFFTDTPDISGTDAGHNGPTYAALHFDGADATPADGAQIQGNLHSNGSTETVVTTHDGLVYFALGIKGDATGFAGDGEVTGDVTAQLDGAGATQVLPDNNGNNDAVNHASHQLLFSTSSFDHVASLNPASTNPLTLATGLFDNNGRYHITTVKPSGDKATTSTNTIPVDTVDTTAGQFDSFGNLVSEPIDVSTSGANGPDFPTRFYGAYAFVNNATADELDFSPNGDDDFFDCTSNEAAQSAGACPEIAGDDDVYVNQLTNPASNTPSTGAETVTMDWDANHTTWKTGVGGVSTNVLNAPDPTTSYTVNWYDREASGFKYLTSMSPKGGKHRAGTPITTTVLVLDSHNRPVNGLGVEFIRSGPKGQSQDTGNPFTCEGTCENIQFTNVSGQAGFTFSTSTPGKYKVTALITDGSGNEVGRAVSHGKLTKKHHKKKHHHHHKKHHHKKHHHKKKH